MCTSTTLQSATVRFITRRDARIGQCVTQVKGVKFVKVGCATRIVTRVNGYTFKSQHASHVRRYLRLFLPPVLHGCCRVCGMGFAPPSVWLGLPCRVPSFGVLWGCLTAIPTAVVVAPHAFEYT